MAVASQGRGRGPLLARSLGEPVPPGWPPRALLLRGAGHPGIRLMREVRIAEERRPLGARRVDNALNVSARAEDEFATTAEDVCRRVARVPGSDMVGDTGYD